MIANCNYNVASMMRVIAELDVLFPTYNFVHYVVISHPTPNLSVHGDGVSSSMSRHVCWFRSGCHVDLTVPRYPIVTGGLERGRFRKAKRRGFGRINAESATS